MRTDFRGLLFVFTALLGNNRICYKTQKLVTINNAIFIRPLDSLKQGIR